jgi:hypothetical protein
VVSDDPGPPAIRRLAAEVAWVVALVALALAMIAADGPRLAHDLREKILWLTPARSIVIILVVFVVVGAWSFVAARWRRPHEAKMARASLPVVAILGSIVVVAATFRVLLVRAATEPHVLGDELVYSGLAKSFALEGRPLFRGDLDLTHSVLYPLLLGPVYSFAEDGARAYEVAKVLDAIVVVSAAIPAYLLARRVASPVFALVVAALVALMPWTAYASFVMTESHFLPAFTTFVLLLARMLERPTRGRQLAVLVALLVVIAVRPQGLVLAASVVAGITIVAARSTSVSTTLRTYAPLLTALAIGIAAALLGALAGVAGPVRAALDVAGSLFDPVGLVKWTLWNLAVYELAVGVVALVAFPLALRAMLRSPLERIRATGVALLTSSVALLVSVAAVSASTAGLDILHERYLFYATPLVFAALACWFETGLERPRGAAWLGGLAVVSIAASLPADQLARANNVDSPTAGWIYTLHQEMPSVPTTVLLVGLAGLGAIVAIRVTRPIGAVLSICVVFVALVGGTDYSGPFTPERARKLGWIDQSLRGRGSVALVHLGYSRPDQLCASEADYEQQWLVVLSEFFNTNVARVYHLDDEQIGRDNLESPSLTVGPGGVVLDRGRPFAPSHVALDSRQPVVGRRLGRLDLSRLGSQYQSGASLTLWEVDPPLRFLVHAQPLPPRADEREC